MKNNQHGFATLALALILMVGGSAIATKTITLDANFHMDALKAAFHAGKPEHFAHLN